MSHSPDIITVHSSGEVGTGRDIQTAIDFALSHSTGQFVVYVPAGRWELSDSLRLYPAETPTPINLSIALVGARPTFGGTIDAAFTTLVCQFNDRPAIDIQATRATTVSNLVLKGQNNIASNLLNIDNIIRDDIWLLDGVSDDHVAIAIDRQSGSGSSSALIDNVSAMWFAGGISIGTSGDPSTLNSDNHTIRRFTGQYLGKAGLIFGQHQSKGVKVQDSAFFGQQYWIDCARYGLRLGYPPVISGCNVGATQRLFNLVHTIGTFACHGLFVESTLSLGSVGLGLASGNIPAVFTGCQFDLFGANGTRVVDTHLYCFRPTLFQGCSFQFNDPGAFSTFRILNGLEVIFDTCVFLHDAKNEHPAIDFHQPSQAEFRRCRYRSPTVGSLPLHGLGQHVDLELGNATLKTVSPGRAEFTISGLSNMDIQPGDQVRPFSAWTPKVHMSNPPNYKTMLSFGAVADIEDDTVILHHVPESIEASLPLTDTLLYRRRATAV